MAAGASRRHHPGQPRGPTASWTCCRTVRPRSVVAWLGQHPTITTVCRDRSDLYANGLRRGAPEAVQVVDRFHRVQNLRQVLEAFLPRNRRLALQAAAVMHGDGAHPSRWYGSCHTHDPARRQHPKPAPPTPNGRPGTPAGLRSMRPSIRLSAQGTPIATMARQLGISRPTVDADLRRDTPPGPRQLQRPPSALVLTPYRPLSDRPLA